jgi:hypothetical protein
LLPADAESVTRSVLVRRNQRLLQDQQSLTSLLAAATIPDGLLSYRDRVLALCTEQEGRIQLNLDYLALGVSTILPDVLSATNLAIEYSRFLSTRLASPVLRAKDTDALCLWTIEWLHRAHAQTAQHAPAMCDGDVAVLPLVDFVPVYFFPSVEQRGLLFQPLLFHEFGHLLYACHKPEMDDLVGDLQQAIEDALEPASVRNDRHAQQRALQRRLVVRVWYRWAQELFCDAVGFQIGGPAFLHAFDMFLSRLDVGDFVRPPEQLGVSNHPVTALRVHFLTRRAHSAGFGPVADGITREWLAVSQALGAATDYHGFYDDSLENTVERALDDMLTEASPRHFTEEDVRESSGSIVWSSPVALCNAAWRTYGQRPDGYQDWETEQLVRLARIDPSTTAPLP